MDINDLDVQSMYPKMFIQPARGNGKSLLQAQIYNELLKESNNMGANNVLIDAMRRAANSVYGLPKDFASAENVAENVEINKEPPEEWVWVKGYKATDAYMRCRDHQYELNKQFDMPEGSEIEVCEKGFHLCHNLKDVFDYYKIGKGNRFFEVFALVRKKDADRGYSRMKNGYFHPHISSHSDKLVAKSITFVRELTVDEVFEAYKSTECSDWGAEDKIEAMKTDYYKVRYRIRKNKLVELGYSEPFAAYLVNHGHYEVAFAVGSQPDLSMDMKCLVIFEDD